MTDTRFPLRPGSVIGIVGGGQLGRMMALAAARLGFDVVVLAKEADSPAGRVASREIVGDYGDPTALRALALASDVLTFEFENVPGEAVHHLQAEGFCVAPPARALEISQDRVTEKSFLNAHGLPTVEFRAVQSAADLPHALQALGAPALLKTRRDGYDGKGQAWITNAVDEDAAFVSIGARPAILEAKALFVRELSVIAARGRDGAISAYPLAENHHEHGVLRRSIAPAAVSDAVQVEAERMVRLLLTALDYVGVIGLELFQLGDESLLINEFAPRVHNTGHWTADGCQVDQFEQHIRAIAGWPLGPTAPLARVEMINLLGEETDHWSALAGERAARLWLYGKRNAAPGRKMGHVNRLSDL